MADYYVDGSGDAIPVLVNLNAYKGVPPLEPLTVLQAVSSAWMTNSPVTLDAMKTYLRVDDSADDALITSLMTAAASYCQDVANNFFVDTSVTVTYADFPQSGLQGFSVPSWASSPVSLAPLPAITYYDTDGTPQTLAVGAELTVFKHGSGLVIESVSGEWPDDYDRTGPRPISLVYGVTADTSLAVIQQFAVAMQMLVGHWYATRDAVCDGNPKEIPFGVNALLQNNTFYGGLS
jgi:uncharacterized phiE125 gp8 family phage protein